MRKLTKSCWINIKEIGFYLKNYLLLITSIVILHYQVNLSYLLYYCSFYKNKYMYYRRGTRKLNWKN
jgi:hypothetical protein